MKRAERLSKYDIPDKAFEECFYKHGEKKSHGYSDWYPTYYRLKDDKINNYSILVTSCNNAAVENITTELPIEKNITGVLKSTKDDTDLQKMQLDEVRHLFTVQECDQEEALYYKNIEKEGIYKDIYFTEYTRSLLDDNDAWGLISAPLGKRSNIHRFYNQVLYPLDVDFYKNVKIEERLEDYKQCRKNFCRQREVVIKLQNKLADFCSAEKRARKICHKNQAKIQAVQNECQELAVLLEDFKIQQINAGKDTEAIEIQLEAVRLLVEKASACIHDLKEQVRITDKEYEERLKASISVSESIGFLERMFHTKTALRKAELADKYQKEAEEKKAAKENLEREIEQAEGDFLAQNKILDDYREQLGKAQKNCDDLFQCIREIENRLEQNDCQVESLKREMEIENLNYREMLEKELGKKDGMRTFTPLDEQFIAQYFSSDGDENTKAQVCNLWFTDEYNRAREKLFYAALKLHKAFVLSSRCCLRNYRNLALLWQERKEENKVVKFHKEDREASFGILLQSLFLLVPVISTTFASAGSFLKDIRKPHTLGMVIVDEAGQAPPQMAIGTLFRCRKAVIVGDPRQVEPVVTDDLLFLKSAFREDVFKPYKSVKNSVQQFADLINPYGTYLENEQNEMEWVGCPLVVHRRCISPMYDISNYISYNNKMKQQTAMPSAKKEAQFCYTGSRWLNVNGCEKGNKNHFVEEQGKRALDLLELAFTKSNTPSLFVITPFTTVRSGMIKCIEQALYGKQYPVLKQKSDYVKEWMYKNIGTVHTFQGKEADEVLFLLGCDTSKSALGAIRWVNANIVNVAVTRAKYRLYVIGDGAAWKESRYISQVKKIMDTFALCKLSRILNDEDVPADRETLVKLCGQLPSAEAISMEEEDEDFIASSDIFLNELKSGDMFFKDLSDKQITSYGFTPEEFRKLENGVRQNLEWGMKLYTLLLTLIKKYQIENLDASCCAILFCKALEGQLKDCFYDNLKRLFPEYKPVGRNHKALKNASEEEMVIWEYEKILRDKQADLAEFMSLMELKQYDKYWWEKFRYQLDNCRQLRNNCCHWKRFDWNQLKCLLKYMFLKTDESSVLKGVMHDSMAGKYLKNRH